MDRRKQIMKECFFDSYFPKKYFLIFLLGLFLGYDAAKI